MQRAEAPDDEAPVTYARLQSVLDGHQREGQAGREQLPQVEEIAHNGHRVQA